MPLVGLVSVMIICQHGLKANPTLRGVEEISTFVYICTQLDKTPEIPWLLHILNRVDLNSMTLNFEKSDIVHN